MPLSVCPRPQGFQFDDIPNGIVFIAKVMLRKSLTISALGEGLKKLDDGTWKYTSSPAHDAAVLAAVSEGAPSEGEESASWPV